MKQTFAEIKVEVNDVITPLSCSSMIIEFIKYVIYQKQLIPYPYERLKMCVNERKKQLSAFQVSHFFVYSSLVRKQFFMFSYSLRISFKFFSSCYWKKLNDSSNLWLNSCKFIFYYFSSLSMLTSRALLLFFNLENPFQKSIVHFNREFIRTNFDYHVKKVEFVDEVSLQISSPT